MNYWRHFPVVIVGSGDSLSDQQCELISTRRSEDACRVIVVNNNFRRVRNADALYACDHQWWKCYHPMRACDGEPGVLAVCPKIQRYSAEPRAIRDFGTTMVHIKGSQGIAPANVAHVVAGSGGGMQATGLAIKWGAQHIILVGMDCKRGKGGKAHWHPDHPPDRFRNPQPFSTWADEFDSLSKPAADLGIDIVNCTIDTAIRRLRRSTLEVELYPEKTNETSSPDAAEGSALSA